MTTQQLHLFNGIYLIVLIVVAVLTLRHVRRTAGALAGASGRRRLAHLASLPWERRWAGGI